MRNSISRSFIVASRVEDGRLDDIRFNLLIMIVDIDRKWRMLVHMLIIQSIQWYESLHVLTIVVTAKFRHTILRNRGVPVEMVAQQADCCNSKTKMFDAHILTTTSIMTIKLDSLAHTHCTIMLPKLQVRETCTKCPTRRRRLSRQTTTRECGFYHFGRRFSN